MDALDVISEEAAHELMGKTYYNVKVIRSAIDKALRVVIPEVIEKCAKAVEATATCPCNGDSGYCMENDPPRALAKTIRAMKEHGYSASTSTTAAQVLKEEG